jgi:hypothetical protein
MIGMRALLRNLRAEQERAERTEQERIERLIAQGPPSGSRIPVAAWHNWHLHGFVACPASKFERTCTLHACGLGVACREQRAIGLTGDGLPLPRKERPTCGARNRQGKPCAVKVEPGKRRCRFHGGLSTGPKTAAGRARIAEAQRRRWNAWRGSFLGGRQTRS